VEFLLLELSTLLEELGYKLVHLLLVEQPLVAFRK
jgi:hypothetical protein